MARRDASGQRSGSDGLRVLALVIDFRTREDASRLAVQVARADRSEAVLTVVHVDNGNADPVALSDAERSLGVELLRLPANGGYAAGVVGAIDRLRGEGRTFDAYWILNSDLEIEPDALSHLLGVLAEKPTVGAVGPRVHDGRSDRVWGTRGFVRPLLGTTGMTDWGERGPLPRWSYLPGCAPLVRAEAYEAVGGLHTRYGMFFEETDLCIQLQRAGWELWVDPAARVYHRPGAEGSQPPSRHHAFFFARNQLYFWRRNFSIPPLVQLPRALAVTLVHLVPPVRHAGSVSEALDRLRYIGLGLLDAFPFLRTRRTPREQRLFGLDTPSDDVDDEPR